MLALLLALQSPVATDTFPLQDHFIDAMPAGKAIVNRNDSVSYKFENRGDSAIAVYRGEKLLVVLQNSLPEDAPIPEPSDEPIWEGAGLKIIFVSHRVSTGGDQLETVGVVRE